MAHRLSNQAALARWIAPLALACFALFAPSAPAHAAGALAIGNCGAWGASYNYSNPADARQRARRECKGEGCRVVATLNGNCAAYSIDTDRRCGAWGWATRPTREAAEAAARAECEKAGGSNCTIRGQVCDQAARPAESAPSMSTSWTSTTLSQEECMDRARAAVRAARLTTNFEVVGQSVFGENGDYTGQTRCIAAKGIVLFVVAGPKSEEARNFQRAMASNF